MAKTISADDAAQRVTSALQPVVDFRVTDAHDSRQDAPTVKPMSPKLEQACGINQNPATASRT